MKVVSNLKIMSENLFIQKYTDKENKLFGLISIHIQKKANNRYNYTIIYWLQLHAYLILSKSTPALLRLNGLVQSDVSLVHCLRK